MKYRVIPKITLANLLKINHDVTIILVSYDTLNLETVKGTEKLQKNEYFGNKKSFLNEIKSFS